MLRLLLFSVFIPLFIICQDRNIDKIEIRHTYEDLYITYIAPLSCEDQQEHGPIVMTDSSELNAISDLLEGLKKDSISQTPDVRFKISIFNNNKVSYLCFGHNSEGIVFNNVTYKYNPELCNYLIKLIEKTGAKKPKRVTPPSPPKNEE